MYLLQMLFALSWHIHANVSTALCSNKSYIAICIFIITKNITRQMEIYAGFRLA